MKAGQKVLWASILCAVCVWLIHAFLESRYDASASWFELALARVPAQSLYSRSVLVLCFLIFGMLLSVAVRKTQEAEESLEQAYGEMELVVKRRTSELRLANAQLTRHQAHLESLVKERASDLVKSNENLRAEIVERERAEEDLRRTYSQLRGTLMTTVDALTSAAEMRDPYTAGHQRQTTALACAIAREMNIPKEEIEGIHVAGLTHDIGKIAIPAEILSKPGRLNEHEMNLIRTHVQVGYDILAHIAFPWPVAQIVLQHHERMDGTGYPLGLKDGDILMPARILAVADVIESMTSHRPFRPALGLEKALEEVGRGRGKAYDPAVVDVCMRLFKEKGFRLERV